MVSPASAAPSAPGPFDSAPFLRYCGPPWPGARTDSAHEHADHSEGQEEPKLTMTTQDTSSSTENFAALFEASLAEGDLGREGEIVTGVVVQVGRDSVVVDIGGKSEGVIARSEFAGPSGEISVKAGDKVDVYIESRENDDGLATLSK